jgi:predicted transposase/invertase (TIGR01784 family)
VVNKKSNSTNVILHALPSAIYQTIKRDTIFYKIFQQSPDRLFELIAAVVELDRLPENTLPVFLPNSPGIYQFRSVEVKETTFRIDGVFASPDASQPVFFAEVQMQKDSELYERIFSEVGMFMRQNHESFSDWQVLAIYPNRATEQIRTKVPAQLFHSGRFLPIYLDELGNIEELPMGLGLMVLTITKNSEAVAGAKNLIVRSRGLAEESAIIGMVAEIIVYKFNQLSREEVDAMLEIKLEETRVYQEAKTEGLIEGRTEGRTEGLVKGRT